MVIYYNLYFLNKQVRCVLHTRMCCMSKCVKSESGRAVAHFFPSLTARHTEQSPTNNPSDTLRKFPNEGEHGNREQRLAGLSRFPLFLVSEPLANVTDLTQISSKRADATIFSRVIQGTLRHTELNVKLHFHFLKKIPIIIQQILQTTGQLYQINIKQCQSMEIF